jgi:hypothetical protein
MPKRVNFISLETTNIHAEVDLERKTQALTQCGALRMPARKQKHWKNDPSPIAFLRAL